MNPKVYSVYLDGKPVATVKSNNDPVGVVRGLFRLTQRYLPWKKIDEKTTLVNDRYKVQEIQIPLGWVKWCPAPT